MKKIEPVRLQRKRTKGFHLESPNGLEIVYVGRPTKYGNPFVVGKPIPKVYLHMSFSWADTMKYGGNLKIRYNDEAVRLFEKYALPNKSDIEELRGKNLCCWCPIDQPCHADVLLELANGEVKDA